VELGIARKISGLGPTGNGGGRGFLLHSALMVSAEGEAIFGLAGQKIWYRTFSLLRHLPGGGQILPIQSPWLSL
jgi:hypothetical protein